MSIRSLAVVATFVLGVIGCDDSEVQSKVADALVHGGIQAELYCTATKAFSKPAVTITRTAITYTAYKFLDGACHAEFCMASSPVATGTAASNKECWQALHPRSASASNSCSVLGAVSLIDTHPSYPFRPGVDGAHVYVEDGALIGEFIENEFNDNSYNCGSGSGSCNEVESWFSHDITTSGCFGRNLEAFGAP